MVGIETTQFRRALIVEDDEHLRRSIARMLRTWGIEAMQARSVEEGCQLLKDSFDLVITDVRLPDGTGLMVADAANKSAPRPLIVAISGVASAGEAFELAQRGVQVYLSKPFTPSQLTAKIAEAIASERAGTPKLASTISAQPATRTGPQLSSNLEGFAERYRLTQRQRSLVRLAVTDIPRRQYADLLGVTENTCKTMIRRLLHKCGARTLADIPRLMLVESASDEGHFWVSREVNH